MHLENIPSFIERFEDFDLGDLYLDRFKINDAPAVFQLRSDPTVLKFISREPMKDQEDAIQWTNERIMDLENNVGVNWVIRRVKGGDLMGTIGFWRYDASRFRAEIGYSLLPQYHGLGIMSRCIKCVLPFAFEKMNMHSIGAEIDPNNEASRKVLEKAGFRKEAHFTEDFHFKGEFSDSAVYSILQKWIS